MADFDYKDFGRDFMLTPVKKMKRLFQIIQHARNLKKLINQLIRQVPAEARNIRITIEYMEAQTRAMKPYQRQIQQVEPKIPQQPTDPTRTLLTWREFSDKVADRIDQLKLNPPTSEVMLIEVLAMMDEDLMDYFEDYLFLMMMKGILFASEHMNRISPKYHFEAGWSPADDKTLANLLAGCHKYLTNWTNDIQTEASKQIDEGVKLGENIEQIGARVAEVVGKSRFRGTVIARTELMRAWNKVAYDRYNKAGFGEAGQIPPAHPLCRCGITVVMTETGFKIVWMTARDPIVCDICQPLDGVPIDEINLA